MQWYKHIKTTQKLTREVYNYGDVIAQNCWTRTLAGTPSAWDPSLAKLILIFLFEKNSEIGFEFHCFQMQALAWSETQLTRGLPKDSDVQLVKWWNETGDGENMMFS